MKPMIVDPETSSILISSAFAKKCFIPGTTEYKKLAAVRVDYPDFGIVKRAFKTNAKQDHFKGLNYDYMRYYIRKVEGENAPALKILEDKIDISKAHSTGKRYPIVKAWFLERYPEVATFGLSEEELAKYEAEKAQEEAKIAKLQKETAEAKAKAAKAKREAAAAKEPAQVIAMTTPNADPAPAEDLEKAG